MTDYSIETVINGVGSLNPQEKYALLQGLGPGAAAEFTPAIGQLHLSWTLAADSYDEAARLGMTMHNSAKYETGVHTPHTVLFCVREVDAAR